MSEPKLKAVVIASGTIHGEFSLRAIRDAKQIPVQLALKDAGFVPGDIVEIALIEDIENIHDLHDRISELEYEVDELQRQIERAAFELER